MPVKFRIYSNKFWNIKKKEKKSQTCKKNNDFSNSALTCNLLFNAMGYSFYFNIIQVLFMFILILFYLFKKSLNGNKDWKILRCKTNNKCTDNHTYQCVIPLLPP